MHKLGSFALSIALASAGAGAADAQTYQGAYRVFRAWVVGCDNGRTCRAIGYPASDGGELVSIRIDREASAAAAPRVFLTIGVDAKAARGVLVLSTESGSLVSLAIGSAAISHEIDTDIVTYEIADAAARDRIIATTRSAQELRVSFDPPVPNMVQDPRVISLDGAAAALLWLDDEQRRVGTVTALVRPGPRPASTIPRPETLPALPARRRVASGGPVPTDLPPAVMEAFRRIPGDDCEQDDEERRAPEIVRLAPRLLLVSLGCWRGAYNESRAYYLIDEGPQPRVRPARFPRAFRQPANAGDAHADHILTNAEFDPETGRIEHFARGRGIGDCGDRGVWQWDGRAFQPVSFTIMPMCRGHHFDWLSLYATRPR